MLLEEDIIDIIKKRFNRNRYEHSLGVADFAEVLAKKEGVDVFKARLAGLLHDYAKGLSEENILYLANEAKLDIDEWERMIPRILHAPVGAYLVHRDLKIEDKDVLEAIRFHTIGSPDMGILAQIIYIADFVEPNRDFDDIDIVRYEVNKGLTPGIIAVSSYSIKYNIEKNRIIHPNTLFLRNSFLGRINLDAEIV
jgi:predicted HD superfamily hydrolase involved in NAD metabolism